MPKLIAQAAPATCHQLEVSDVDLLAIERDDLIDMLFYLSLASWAFDLHGTPHPLVPRSCFMAFQYECPLLNPL